MPLRPETLSRREREIMDALFALGEAPADAIRERLIDAPSYSAVRAMLVRLEKKGHVRHREDGPRYLYQPTTSRATARRAALQQLVRTFFDGSAPRTATALLAQDAWSDDELEALRDEIDRVRNERRRQ